MDSEENSTMSEYPSQDDKIKRFKNMGFLWPVICIPIVVDGGKSILNKDIC